MRFSRLAVFSLLFFFGTLSPAYASLGTFHLPSLGAGEFVRTVPCFNSPFSESYKGRVEVGLQARWLNTWAHHTKMDGPKDPDNFGWNTPEKLKHGSFLMDVESLALTPSILVRLTPRLAVDVSLPVAVQGGGIMDGFIEGFHSLVGVGQHDRDHWHRGRSGVQYVDKNDNVVDLSDDVERVITGDAQIAVSVLALENPMITLRGIAKLPTSRMYDDQENSGTDFTGQALWAWQWGRFVGIHGVGATFYTREGEDDLDLERIRYSSINSFEYMASDTFSWLVVLNSASKAANYPELDKPVVELTMGIKRIWGPGIFEFGLIENLFFFDNSPDFGVHMGYTLKFL